MPKTALIKRKKKIALIAHDNKKQDMMEWAKFNIGTLEKHQLYATGTTGRMLEKELGLDIDHLGVRTVGRRPTNRRLHRQGRNRFSNLLLGSACPIAT